MAAVSSQIHNYNSGSSVGSYQFGEGDDYSHESHSTTGGDIEHGGWISVNAAAYVDDNSTITSVDDQRKKVRRAIQSMKDHDPGYHAILDKSGEKMFEFYASNSNPGFKIRDAVSGIRYDQYRVGSDAERLFFKVSYNANHGKSELLFFHSPDEYERFFNLELDNSSKTNWALNNKAVLKKYGY